ncbi:MAG: aminopeptidase P family protein [Bacteroidaceae bacterium]|nr:aminopeptidase P family protein [Bacteroidaceae bacterium]
MNIPNRLKLLRQWMQQNQLSAYIIPSTDPHCGEYVPEYWEARKWISGFTGSAGTAVVTLDKAALWTDSRYFIQARQQLNGTGFEMMKERVEGTPTQGEWLKQILPAGSTVGLCGEMFAQQEFEDLQIEIAPELQLASTEDPFTALWTDRPSLPEDPVYPQPLYYAGRTASEKLSDIRTQLESTACEAILLSALDEVAWTTNLRGSDIHCNPVFVSYLLIQHDKATLYINKKKVPQAIADSLQEQGITLAGYSQVFVDVANLSSLWLAPGSTNHAIYQHLSENCLIYQNNSPVSLMKAVKNEAEINGFHQAMLHDGIAMVKFLHWLKPAVQAGGQTECSIAEKLNQFRSEYDDYQNVSFDTIAGYQAHGAIVHYEPTPESDIPVLPEGLLLLDSGGQYPEGTTDITRTIALGPVTDEMKRDYTLILKGFIQLGLAKFPEGTCGTQLDILARQAIWSEGKNYFHGTGHGVGSHLCCHEGPHQIRMNHMPAALRAGMTVTDEPGLYIEGKYGIRTEDTLLVVPFMETEFGRFLQFEHLTLCPIDTTPIELSLLTPVEKDWLNQYHKHVYETLLPYLSAEVTEWLKEATKAI